MIHMTPKPLNRTQKKKRQFTKDTYPIYISVYRVRVRNIIICFRKSRFKLKFRVTSFVEYNTRIRYKRYYK